MCSNYFRYVWAHSQITETYEMLFGELNWVRIWLVNLTLAEYVNLSTLIVVVQGDLAILFISKKKIMRTHANDLLQSFIHSEEVSIISVNSPIRHNHVHAYTLTLVHIHTQRDREINNENWMWTQYMTECNCMFNWIVAFKLWVNSERIGIGWIVNKGINLFGINSISIYKWQLKKLNTSVFGSV